MFRLVKLATIGWMAFKWLRRNRASGPAYRGKLRG